MKYIPNSENVTNFSILIRFFLFCILIFASSLYPIASNINTQLTYPTIQAAVNSAANNHTIHIYPGIYNENININSKSGLNLIGLDWISSSDNSTAVLNASGGADGILLVNANNISIQGISIINAQQSGIYVQSSVHSTAILNNFISGNTDYAVHLHDSTNNLVIANTLMSNNNTAVMVNGGGSSYNQILSNTITGSDQGIGIQVADGGDNNNIIANSVQDCKDKGIDIWGSAEYLVIAHNNVSANATNGIKLNWQPKYNQVFSNDVYGPSQEYGIWLSDSACTDNRIFHNTVRDNTVAGIYINDAFNNDIFENISFGSSQPAGILVASGQGNFIASNILSNNMNFGAELRGNSGYNQFAFNLSAFNGSDGIRLGDNSEWNDIINNTVYGNTGDGIEITGSASANIHNNIFINNGANGLNETTSQNPDIDYNNYFNNTTAISGASMGINATTGNPLLDVNSGFEITNENSSAVDAGTIYAGVTGTFNGGAPDQGWKETPYTTPEATNLIWYVNDDSLTSDVYTTAVGVDAPGRGMTPSTPCRTVSYLLSQYRLGGNLDQIVYVDTGSYTDAVNLSSATVNNPSPTNRLSFTGAGPQNTIIQDAPTFGFNGNNIDRITISGFCVSNMHLGINLDMCEYWIISNVLAVTNGQNGFRLSESHSNLITHCEAWGSYRATATNGGEALGIVDQCSNTIVRYSQFYNNMKCSVFVDGMDSLFEFCIMAGSRMNNLWDGNGILVWGGDAAFINCTISGNRMAGIAYMTGTAWNPPAGLTVKNTILAHNDVNGINNSASSPVAISYSLVSNGNGFNNFAGVVNQGTGISNNAAPLFASLDFNDPSFLRLTSGSPAIDTADPADDWRPERIGPHLDMGRWEFTSGPVVQITNIAPDSWLSTTPRVILGSASGGTAVLDAVYFSTDGISYLPVTGTTAWSTNLDLTPYTGGPAIFYLLASNIMNDTGYYQQTNFIDLTPPVISIEAPAAASTISATVTYSGTNYDDYAPLTAAYYSINGGAWTTFPSISEFWTLAVDTTLYADGQFTLAVLSSNAAGLSTTVITTNLIANSSGLIAETNTPALALISGHHYFAGYASNVNPSLDPFTNYIRIDGGPYTIIDSSTAWSTNLDTTLLTDGLHSFDFLIVNALGQSNSHNQQNTVDNSAPLLSITSPAVPGESFFGIFEIQGTCNDPHSGISTLTITISNELGTVLVDQQDITSSLTGVDWRFNIDSEAAGLDNLDYYISVTAVNGVGISNTSGPVQFSVNNLDFAPMIGPNPWVEGNMPMNGISGVLISGLKRSSLVRIYSVNGNSIRDFKDFPDDFTGYLEWDTRNTAENKVGSGIYIIYIQEDENSEILPYKLVVRRK